LFSINIKQPHHQAYILLVIATFFWSANFVLARAMSTSIPPITMSYWRWQIAALILFPFAIKGVWQHRAMIKQHFFPLLALSILGVTCFNTFVYLGLQTTSATNALLINSSIPVWIIFLALTVFKEKTTLLGLFAVALSVFGVVYLIVHGELAQLSSLNFYIGDMWIFAAALVWALYSLLLKFWKPAKLPPVTFLMFSVLVGSLALGLVYWPNITDGTAVVWNWQALSSVAYFAIFPSLISFICWNEGVARVGASIAGRFIHLMPLFGMTLSILFLDETIQLYHFVGGAFIATGILLALKK
jgi:drug/metabolite transporter (DMT)-like permease